MLPLETDKSRFKDSQSYIVWRESSLYWRSLSGLSSQHCRNPTEDRKKDYRSQTGWRLWLTASTNQGSSGLTETEVGSLWPARAVPGPLHMCYDCQLGVFDSAVGADMSLTILPDLRTFSFYWVAL